MSDAPMTGKYKAVDPCAVRRIADEAAEKYRGARDADKAVKNTLHLITGVYAAPSDMKRARRILSGPLNDQAIDELLKCHASTRERAASSDVFCREVLEPYGVKTFIDLACGLNPIDLGRRGYAGTGYDINGDCVELCNACAARMGWPVRAVLSDLLGAPSFDEADAALLMKLLPVLEKQRAGASVRLIDTLRTPLVVVTFPLKTLSGRSVGMDAHYTQWFESLPITRYRTARRIELPNEVCYCLERRND